jgi:thiol-disulfide isomerase/thioredoxin
MNCLDTPLRRESVRGGQSARGVALTVVIGLALAWPANPAMALEEGESAPVFTARALSGAGNVSLSDYKGKVVYLDFWASWCAPCLVSLPLLDELRKEFPGDQLQVVAVNVDQDVAKGRDFFRRRPVGYPSATDPAGQIPEKYGITTMPTSFLIDRGGIVRYVHKGFRKTDVSDLRAKIQQLVDEAALPASRAKGGGR